jgi:hypothetical protein
LNFDQYDGFDSSLSRDLVQDQQRLLERRFVIKRWAGTSGGNSALGQQPVKTFVLIETPGQMKMMTGKDVVNGGGLYEEGDLEVTTQMPVFGADNKNKTNVDSMIMDGQVYQMVGKPFPVPLAGGVTFNKSHWRRQE